ncbi:MAG: hypothetical protein HZC12_04785 [Nitrospirae bacterium]|nr:hypothetical protein [Nitrospirota bacterium]
MIISIAGSHSKVGKTTLASILLGEIKGFGAIKFTKTAFYTSIVSDERILRQKGKDTAVMLEAGAVRVLWVQCPEKELAEALPVALSEMSGLNGIIVEGNSPVDFLTPHLVIFITDPHGRLKSSAQSAVRKADVIVINSEKNGKCPALLNCPGARVFWIDLLKRKGELNEFLSFVKERIDKSKLKKGCS